MLPTVALPFRDRRQRRPLSQKGKTMNAQRLVATIDPDSWKAIALKLTGRPIPGHREVVDE
jgi:hypothetical protein